MYLVKFYQASFSHFLGGNCRFYPSCSHYAVESFQSHTFLKAFRLTIVRLLKCHPFYPQKGFDPVPKAHTGSRVADTQRKRSNEQ
ncbi:MAG: membrane protein insertion efficiency factor YidD [Bdellovibrionota bacterium]